MSDMAWMAIAVGLLVGGILGAFLMFSVTFVRGYQMGWRDHALGAPHAFTWPPLPKRLRDYPDAPQEER